MEVQGNAIVMPEYQCHKKVRALKISSVRMMVSDTECVLTYEGIPNVEDLRDVSKKPTPEAGWYIVQYDNGYVSYSPAKAFEEGYTLIEA